MKDNKINLKDKSIIHKDKSLNRLKVSFLKHIELEEYKKSELLAYWIYDYAIYHDEEKTFNIAKSGAYSRGMITPAEKVREWESFDLCAPGDAIGSAANRCKKFGYNCHECLIDYASGKDEYHPLELSICHPYDDKQNN